MKEFVSTITSTTKRLLKKELGSTAGKVNLVGGAFLILLAAGYFIQGILHSVFNAILVYFNKPTLPDVSPLYFLLVFAVTALYFYFCAKVVE